jgi:phage gpG-like protein
MISVKISQSSLTKAVGAFNKYAQSVEKKVNRAKAITALNVERKAKENVTVDTGPLRSSITIGKTTDGELAVGSNKEYALRIEFGFFDKTDKLGRRFMQKAQPYLFPAAESERKAHLKRLIEASIP